MRPSWDDIFMEIAFVFSKRSPDTTKHGACIVSADKRQISLGYNGYPRNCNHEKMPKERPFAYKTLLHAEGNAILNANFSMKGATIYVTGEPCSNCLAMIIQKEISRVVYGPVTSKCVDEGSKKASQLLLEDQNIEVVKYDGAFLKDDHDGKGYLWHFVNETGLDAKS